MTPLRIICFLILLFASVFVPPWILIPFVAAYAFRFHAYELIVAAACIDAYLGLGMGAPYYTLGVSVIVVFFEWLKPSLSFYTERT